MSAEPMERLAAPWNGVNLGGWLLLEPGPARPLFDVHLDGYGEEARCEWDLMRLLRARLGDAAAEAELRRHREGHVTRVDFEKIRDCGLNAVRLPFGYWVALGPRDGEPYAGPALEYIDRALDWAEEYGLQVVLDLHGCPGGESGDAPCGRRQRPEGTWQWQQWDMEMSLKALEVVCTRYRSRSCVTGVEVCNEPSNVTPLKVLSQYYVRATQAIRSCGMSEADVTVVLPVFQRPEEEFAKAWEAASGGLRGVCFDTHCYHCFGAWFHGLTFAQQLRHMESNGRMLDSYPMVVGEWSLALGTAAWNTRGTMTDGEAYRLFGQAQLAAYGRASHGHFFWNWSERRETVEWNFQESFAKGYLSGPLPELPAWSGRGEDPLEEQLNPSPTPDSRVLYGERVFLRAFHGNYVDARGGAVSAGWSDRGPRQQITIHPAEGGHGEIRHGDVVHLEMHNGRYLSIGEGKMVEAVKEPGASARLVVHLGQSAHLLRHRGQIYFESRRHGVMVDADENKDGLAARFHDLGEWQRFAVEKPPAPARGGPRFLAPPAPLPSRAMGTSPRPRGRPPSAKRRCLLSPASSASASAPPSPFATASEATYAPSPVDFFSGDSDVEMSPR